MSNGYWAGDAIATNLERQADAARSASEMRLQQSYYTGLYVTLKHALAALREASPQHPLNNPAVRAHFDRRGRAAFYQVGLDRACDLAINPFEVQQELQTEFEAHRVRRINEARAEPIKKRRAGWWWARRDVWSWRGQDEPSEQKAKALQAAEIHRLTQARLGEPI